MHSLSDKNAKEMVKLITEQVQKLSQLVSFGTVLAYRWYAHKKNKLKQRRTKPINQTTCSL